MSAFMWDSGKWFWMRNAHDKPIPLSEQQMQELVYGPLKPDAALHYASILMSDVDLGNPRYEPVRMAASRAIAKARG